VAAFSNLPFSRYKRKVYNAQVRIVFEPLIECSTKGIITRGPRNKYYLVYPRLWGIMVDYEEATYICGVRKDWCPHCLTPKSEMGSYRSKYSARSMEDCNLLMDHYYELIAEKDTKSAKEFAKQIRDKGFAPLRIWCHDWTGSDVYRAWMLDLLHQLQKGVVYTVYGLIGNLLDGVAGGTEVKRRFDARCAAVNRHPGARYFTKPLYKIKLLNGKDMKGIMRMWVTLLYGLPFKGLPSDRTVRQNKKGRIFGEYDEDKFTDEEVHDCCVMAVKHLVNFWYLADTEVLMEYGLACMEHDLREFEQYRAVLVRYQPSRWTFIKAHTLMEYADFIRQNGTPLQYTTGYHEKQHIRDCKVAYRAGNKRDIEGGTRKHVGRRLAFHQRRRRIADLSKDSDAEDDAEDEENRMAVSGNIVRVRKVGLVLAMRATKNRMIGIEHLDTYVGVPGSHIQRCLRNWIFSNLTDPETRENVRPSNMSNLPYPDQHGVEVWQGVRVTWADEHNDNHRETQVLRCYAKESPQGRKGKERRDDVLINVNEDAVGHRRYAVGKLLAIVSFYFHRSQNPKPLQVVIVQEYHKVHDRNSTATAVTGMVELSSSPAKFSCYLLTDVVRNCDVATVWKDGKGKTFKTVSQLKDWSRHTRFLLNHHHDKWSYWNLY